MKLDQAAFVGVLCSGVLTVVFKRVIPLILDSGPNYPPTLDISIVGSSACKALA